MTGGVFFHGHDVGPVTFVVIKDLRPFMVGMATGFGEIGMGHGHLCLPFIELSCFLILYFLVQLNFFSDSEFFFLRLDESFHSVFPEFI